MASKRAYRILALFVAAFIAGSGTISRAHAQTCFLGEHGDVVCPRGGIPPFTADPGILIGLPGSFNPARPIIFGFLPTGPMPATLPQIGACRGVSPYEIFSQREQARNGYHLVVYRDALGRLMAGVGHIVTPADGLTLGSIVTPFQIKAWWDADSAAAYAAAQAQAKMAGICDGCFVSALASVNYQMGTAWITKFPGVWAAIMAGNYDEAADMLNGTAWAAQDPIRVRDFQMALHSLPPKSIWNCFTAPPIIPIPDICDFVPELCEPFYNPCADGGTGGGNPGSVCSSLGWLSGAYEPRPGFEALRPNNPAKSNICLSFSKTADNWADLSDASGGTVDHWLHEGCQNLIVALRIFPMGPTFKTEECPSNYRRIANGEFDSYYIAMAEDLKRAGVPANAVFRIGWELNSDYPWGILGCRTPADAQTYIAGFRHIVDLLRAHFSNEFTVSWNFLKRSSQLALPIDSYYPGDTYVDYISVDYYDAWPNSPTMDAFNALANDGTATVPLGINTWLAYATSKGKKIAFDEWGVVPPSRNGAGDNPVYIQAMFEWFRAHACSLGYESYFNGASRGHGLDNGDNPRSTEMYRSLWGPSTSRPRGEDEVCSCTPAP